MSSLKKIAKETGFSIATVSRALNNSSQVIPETREIIQSAAKSLNYRPNPAAKALATKRSFIVGAAIPGIEHSIFSKFLAAMEAELSKFGYSLVLTTTHHDAETEFEKVRNLINMGAEAIVLSGLYHFKETIKLAQDHGVLIICTSVYDKTSQVPTIGYDNQALGAQAVEYLQSLGHRNITVLHGPSASNDRTRLRLAGIDTVHGESIHRLETKLSVEGGMLAAKVLFNQYSDTTAILCLSDVLAEGVLFEAARQNIKVPDQISVMGFDNLEWSGHIHPTLTTIDLPVDEMGLQTALQISAALDLKHEVKSLLLDAAIIERQSTARSRTE